MDGGDAEVAEAAWPRCNLEGCRRPFRPGTGRGPGGTICSRSGCRREVYGKSAKDKQIDELRARLTEKDALIASYPGYTVDSSYKNSTEKKRSFLHHMAAYAPGGGVKVLHFATPAPMPPSSRQQQSSR